MVGSEVRTNPAAKLHVWDPNIVTPATDSRKFYYLCFILNSIVDYYEHVDY